MAIVKNIMSTRLTVVSPEPEWDLLAGHSVQAARRMQKADIHRLLVMEEGRLKGIISTSDVTRAVALGKA